MARIEECVIKRVAVIGAGPGGIAAAKYLIAESAFPEIVIFEQRLSVGGVWNATPSIRTEKHFTIPQTRPSLIPGEPIQENGAKGSERKFEFLSPIYDDLDTNIPQMLMKYSDYSFPKGTSLFPRHDVVLEYLERYADEVRHLIRFGAQVLDVRLIPEDGGRDKWSISTKNMKTGEESQSNFDAVIVANGHYNDPYVPDILGIKEWNARYLGSISHSKFYRKPDDFKNKKVLVIGNSASGTDLAAQIAPFCTQPLLISARSPATQLLPSTPPIESLSLPEIAHFNAQDRSIVFKDSHIEHDIDSIIFCTGYLYSFPFLSSLDPPLLALHGPNAGTRVHNLYQHIFYRPHPTLSFIALPQRIVPFPLAESQASIIAGSLSTRLSLPPAADMQAWETDLLERKRAAGYAKFHLLGHPDDADYINSLHAWAMRASPLHPSAATGFVSGAAGKQPPFWGDEECWVRERTPLIKKAARELDARERGEVRTLEELGFDFRAWERVRRAEGRGEKGLGSGGLVSGTEIGECGAGAQAEAQ